MAFPIDWGEAHLSPHHFTSPVMWLHPPSSPRRYRLNGFRYLWQRCMAPPWAGSGAGAASAPCPSGFPLSPRSRCYTPGMYPAVPEVLYSTVRLTAFGSAAIMAFVEHGTFLGTRQLMGESREERAVA